MGNVVTSLTISAPPARVWQVLTDFAAYPEWNPVITSLRGETRVGATVHFRIIVPPGPSIPFAAKVTRCEPEREFAWRGGAPVVPALAWGEHWFKLAPCPEGTLFTHGEDFGGLLALVMRTSVRDRTERAYDALNRALKARAEAMR